MQLWSNMGANIVQLESYGLTLSSTHVIFEPTIFIEYFYKPKILQLSYQTSPFHSLAKETALKETLDPQHPVGVVFTKDNQIISTAANGSEYHNMHGCYRKSNGIPTGARYELCEGCHPKHHAESKAIVKLAATAGSYKAKELLTGSIAHLHGHWYCCEPCTLLLEDYKVSRVFIEREWVKNHLSL